MRVSTYVILAAATAVSAQSATPSAQPAPVVTNNPIGAEYVAILPEKEGSTVRGSVTARTQPDGKGIGYAVAISGLPAEGGPFMYHIHEKPVPADGNCTGTGAHLDPYKRGEVPVCDAEAPQTCQTGDLAGKYGNLTTPGGSYNYVDSYTSTNPSDPSFIGGLSIVVHLSNKTRIACANFSQIAGGASSSLASTAMPSSGYAMPSSGSVVPSSGVAMPSGTGIQNSTGSAVPTGTGVSHKGSASETFHSASPTQPTAPSQPSSGADRLMAGGAAALAGVMALML